MTTRLCSPRQVDPRSRERGFALLMTLTLLAFLVLLLVGLATYTRVETAIAGNTQRQAQARENAVFALNVAVGQLQIYAGPDQRVTATAGAFENRAGTRPYTGVWATAVAPETEAKVPLTWLVSGNELADADGVAAPLAVTPETALTTTTAVALVSTNTSRTANDVLAQLVPVTAMGVPGVAATTSATIGRYAWWVGDQGVKAPVAVPDKTAEVNYEPYTSSKGQSRIRQQMSLGAGAVDASTNGNPTFEPRDSNNVNLVRNQNIAASGQMAFLRNATNAPLGLLRVQQNFHSWSPNNYAVLANTKLGGLRRDLSIDPSSLGAEVKTWLDYSAYMETPPDAQNIKRRYRLTEGSDTSYRVAPVLSFFLLSFNIRTVPTAGNNQAMSPGPVQARLRGAFSLWNPYTSALVPEDLRMEITGLPENVELVNDTQGGSRPIPRFSLESLFGTPLKFSLKWNNTIPVVTTADRESWLPGRTYSWTILEDTSAGSPPIEGYPCRFYSQDIDGVSGQGIQTSVSSTLVDGSDRCHLEISGDTNITIRLFAVRAEGDVLLATFNSPTFENRPTTSRELGSFTYTPTFVFRLAENDTGPGAWLTTPGVDPRNSPLPKKAYVAGTTGNVNGPFSELYENVRRISAPDRLLDRDVLGYSYNEDTPVFELPRSPILSVGSLQHVGFAGQRPFTIGNSWADQVMLNGIPALQIFDRYFFSGLTSTISAPDSDKALILPNSLLKVSGRKSDGDYPLIADFKSAADAKSSKFVLQSGAFNINSVNEVAWISVLRGVRFPTPETFTYLAPSLASGTADNTFTQSQSSASAHFLRFAQSAQETYKAEQGGADSSSAAEGPSSANTHLFRQGLRTLDAGQVGALAKKLVELIQLKHAAGGNAGGPFRSLEEFLAPSALFGAVDADGNAGPARSLLEAAIADTGLNADIAEFSSQWLTQADVMTALAPVLFPRSDTFIVRAYGEAVNPATNATEGRAWCEAIVQRLPEFMDPADPPETELAAFDLPTNPDDPDSTVSEAHVLNKTFGRRFKIVSFRWLTRSDI